MNHQVIFSFLFLVCLLPSLIFSQDRALRPVLLQIPSGEQIELYKGSFALVIGVSDYQDNAWADLTSVPKDVNAVSNALQRHGFEVTKVLNPTESELISAIDNFIDNHGYDKDNRLLIYYSGHGHTIERDDRKFGYLVPVDAPSPIDNEKEFFGRAIKMERIISWAKQIESKHALFLFDSCFSGSVLESRAITVPEDISYSTSKPVRQFISAGSANQTVPAVSVFRPTFIRGINGEADLDKDGYVTGVELGMYLQKRVPYYQSGQTPQYGKIREPYLDEGNFVFSTFELKGATADNLELERIDSDQNKKDSSEESVFEEFISESSLGEKHSVYYGLSLSINGEEGGGDSLGYTHPTGFGIYTFLYAKIELPDVEEGETTEGAGYGYVLTYRKNLFDNYFLIGLGSFNNKGFTLGGNSSDETNFEGSIIGLVGYFYPITDSFSILINAVSVSYSVKGINDESYTNNGIFHIAGSYNF